MTREEFSNEFDFMVGQIANQVDYAIPIHVPIAFNEYEKSVFLTNAQNDLVLSYYTGRNERNESFEATEEMRRYLDELVVTVEPTAAVNETGKLTPKSKLYVKPTDLWFITYEQAKLRDACSTIIPVIPISQDEFYNSYNNPFRMKNRALRLDCGNGNLEIVCEGNIKEYTIRYVKKLNPIILVDLGNEVTIEGEHEPQDCQLNSALHRDILRIAVTQAIQTF